VNLNTTEEALSASVWPVTKSDEWCGEWQPAADSA